ncbi:MAG TPA: ABC transporter permease [Candidatus Methanoperedens sp.]|nr:ABC transporter permease [Candidatus Methanoperedens sp.]
MSALAGAWRVWLRNAAVWRKSWKTSLVGSVGEPLLYVLGLGYGLATVVPDVDGSGYLRFVAPGLMLSSVMQSATIEATYMSFTKMEHQRVFAGMILAPLGFGDILLGEILWAMTKGLICGGAVLTLLLAAGVAPLWPGLLALPLILLAGFIFASLGLVVTSVARGYESFNYYFTLWIAPMFFFSGIFFPVRKLGPWVERLSWVFPLTPLVALSRRVLTGTADIPLLTALAAAAFFAAAAFLAALSLMRRRFIP